MLRVCLRLMVGTASDSQSVQKDSKRVDNVARLTFLSSKLGGIQDESSFVNHSRKDMDTARTLFRPNTFPFLSVGSVLVPATFDREILSTEA